MNILIADDHDIFRQSLAFLLEHRSTHKVVGHVASFTDLIQHTVELEPDCILLDYHMPGGDPLKISEQLKRIRDDVKIIMLTGAQSGAILKQLSANVFAGVLHKKDDAETILHGIECVDRGDYFVSDSVNAMISEVAVELTQREVQVLTLFMRGLSPSSIADDLNISVRTVEKHKENMMRKLDVSSTVQLVEAGHRVLLDE